MTRDLQLLEMLGQEAEAIAAGVHIGVVNLVRVAGEDDLIGFWFIVIGWGEETD